MKLDEKLNLVIPVNPDKEGNAERYFHSAPIMRDTYRRYHFIIAKTFNVLFANDMQITGPKIAAMTLQEIAEEMGLWDDQKNDKGAVIKVGVKSGLMDEIMRMTNTVVFTDAGWKSMPVYDAIKRDLMTEEEWDDAVQRIVFFMLASAILPAGAARDLNQMACELWMMRLTSLACTAFADSLPVSTQEETGQASAEASPAIC